MKTKFNLHKKGWQFCVLVMLLSCIPYYFVINDNSSDSSWTLVLMWIPALAAIIMRLYHKEGLFTGVSWNPLKDWKWLVFAAFIPLLIEISTLLLTLLFNAATLKEGFISIENGNVSVKGVAMIFGATPQPWYAFIGNYALSYFIGTLLYSLLFAFGEEYGWRGYLQQKWASDTSLKGFIAIGIVWGLWHLPAILLGHNYPEYPIIGGFILMPLLCTIFSIVFGIAMLRKNVIWIAVVFHGALNISSDVSNTAFVASSLNRPINDFIWTFLWLLTAVLFWFKIKKKKTQTLS
ncbi:CPBP family intramembrane glutamic endopeptidase [Kordia sp.]|uniref:CPBP family intramembrane glutamic endopeptidase n=1 Tax=Kordia sp. TaxID=1965332 RepID=UPI003D2C7743